MRCTLINFGIQVKRSVPQVLEKSTCWVMVRNLEYATLNSGFNYFKPHVTYDNFSDLKMPISKF